LILLDLNLPGIDGRDILTEIKTDPHLKPIPVVVLTTSSAPKEVVHSYELYANCHVKKPAGLQRFMEVLRAIETFWLSVVELPPTDAHYTTGTESLAAGAGQ
jgi:CheY-like chemotaxis protein